MDIVKLDVSTFQFQDAYLIHGVNMQGVMGAGIAKAIRGRWQNIYNEYLSYVRYNHSLELGDVQFVDVGNNVVVCNAFTQEYYGRGGVFANAQIIPKCLYLTLDNMLERGYNTLYSPKMGCGLGGLSWQSMLPVYEEFDRICKKNDVNLIIFDK